MTTILDHNKLEWEYDSTLIIDKFSVKDSRRVLAVLFLAQNYLENLNAEIIDKWRNLSSSNLRSEEIEFGQLKSELFDSEKVNFSKEQQLEILINFFNAGLLALPSSTTQLFKQEFEDIEESDKVFIFKGVHLFQCYTGTGPNTLALTIETIYHILTKKYDNEIGIQSLHKQLNRLIGNRCTLDNSILHNFVNECQPSIQIEAEPLIREKYYYLHPDIYTILQNTNSFPLDLNNVIKLDLLDEWIAKAEKEYKHKVQLIFKTLLVDSFATKIRKIIDEYLVSNGINLNDNLNETWFNTIATVLRSWKNTYQWIESIVQKNSGIKNHLITLANINVKDPIDQEWLAILNSFIVVQCYLNIANSNLSKILPKSLTELQTSKSENAIHILHNNPDIINVLYIIASEIETYLHFYPDNKIKRVVYQFEQREG